MPVVRPPDDGYIKTLCVGPGASIWKYITQHVYKERNVRVMRGNIQWYPLSFLTIYLVTFDASTPLI
uniref:Uncharacterized protein n=1 Tax=Sinocyclocheilus grahami TaxID=75366 RepID=A0A672LZA8_SINGR